MTTLTITLNSTETKALEYAALSPSEWADTVIRHRANVAIDEIVQIAIAKCLEAQQPIPNSKDLIVEMAYTNGWVKTVAQRNAEFEAAARAGQNETNTNV
jgi:hypothetical protein